MVMILVCNFVVPNLVEAIDWFWLGVVRFRKFLLVWINVINEVCFRLDFVFIWPVQEIFMLKSEHDYVLIWYDFVVVGSYRLWFSFYGLIVINGYVVDLVHCFRFAKIKWSYDLVKWFGRAQFSKWLAFHWVWFVCLLVWVNEISGFLFLLDYVCI